MQRLLVPAPAVFRPHCLAALMTASASETCFSASSWLLNTMRQRPSLEMTYVWRPVCHGAEQDAPRAMPQAPAVVRAQAMRRCSAIRVRTRQHAEQVGRHAEAVAHEAALVGKQQVRQAVLGAERLVARGRVRRDADHLAARVGERRVGVAEGAGLLGAAGRVVFRVKEHHQRLGACARGRGVSGPPAHETRARAGARAPLKLDSATWLPSGVGSARK